MRETATNNSVQGEETEKVNLVKISARINQKIDDVMREMAKEYGVSFSEVVRLAIDGHLEQYFGNVQYGCRTGKRNQNEMCIAWNRNATYPKRIK